VTTWDHPVQSLVWDDFTAKADHEYEYIFHPLKGKAKNLDRSEKPICIRVKTELSSARELTTSSSIAALQAARPTAAIR
jgi:hypothetical protein